ncbi:phosphoglycerate mutase-like protein [Mycena maculata]|uniref:Phosphoglycerate mutase-like protein n=1 Tax=Mycena maculata TaxID=230809 RepID=A0AAD7NI81_9AGAR|nr:phosphoglycerate mutase-like protein [Mycena maculata]
MSRARATFTFIRHGESTDNVRSVWAGWADATLSNHGMNQAQAVAASLAGTQFTAIHSSPSKRAYMTAEEIHKQQFGVPQSALTTSLLLREQHFGVAEGKSLTGKRDPDLPLVEHFNKGIYPSSLSRSERFPEGESLDDVQVRATRAWADILLPYVRQAAREGTDSIHIAVISHGVFIKEALRALAKYDRAADISVCDCRWLRNTAWARVVVGLKDFKEDEEPILPQGTLPPLQVHLTSFNQCEHLATVKRQKGGTGREAYDPRQKDIRGFFGGMSRKPASRSSRPI